MKGNQNCSGKYVYCIIKCPEDKKSFGNIGFGGEEVYTQEYRDFAPVISDAPMKEYEINEIEIETHRKVVEKIMEEYSVIPVSYGMIFKNKKLLSISMKAGYKAMKKAMKTIENKAELGIKVILPKGATELNGQMEQLKSDFIDSLDEIAVDTKQLKIFSDRLLLNASFLVDMNKIDNFSDQVSQFVVKYDTLKIQYSGPWPPYNFVDIHILGKKQRGFR